MLAVMPTGSGKSLGFQLLALRLPGTTLVVSPLIALMKDQVDELTRRGIRAAALHSLASPDARRAALDARRTDALQLLYVAPERLASPTFTPRPRINLLLYYGVLGARSAWRSRIAAIDGEHPASVGTRGGASRLRSRREGDRSAEDELAVGGVDAAELWLRRLGVPALRRPVKLIALIEDPLVIRRILSHLGLPTEVPAAHSARPPPLPIGRADTWYDDDITVP